jgi:hypothetical protein
MPSNSKKSRSNNLWQKVPSVKMQFPMNDGFVDSLTRIELHQSTGSLFQPNPLPDPVNQLLLDVCTVLVAFSTQIRELDETHTCLKSEIKRIRSRAERAPEIAVTTDEVVFVDPHVTDISPLIRGLHRDSRRIDGLNEVICDLRREHESVLKAVADTDAIIEQNQHQLHGFGASLLKVKDMSLERTHFFQTSIASLENQVLDLCSVLSSVVGTLNALVSAAADDIDELQNRISELTRRPYRPIEHVSKLIHQSQVLRDSMLEKRAQFTQEREHLRLAPLDRSVDKILNEIRGNCKNEEEYKFRLGDSASKRRMDAAELQLSVEDLRMGLNELRGTIAGVQENLTDLASHAEKRLERKVESATVQRVFDQIEAKLGPMSPKSPKRSPPRTPTELSLGPTRRARTRLHEEVFGKKSQAMEQLEIQNSARRRTAASLHLASSSPRELRR